MRLPKIETRLDRCGFDLIDINAEVFIQAREHFDMFDQLMHAAQRRRIGLLREISIRRELLIRAQRFADDPSVFDDPTRRLKISKPLPLKL
jgi:hypothetical protein